MGLALDDAHAVVVSCGEFRLWRLAHLDALPAGGRLGLLSGPHQTFCFSLEDKEEQPVTGAQVCAGNKEDRKRQSAAVVSRASERKQNNQVNINQPQLGLRQSDSGQQLHPRNLRDAKADARVWVLYPLSWKYYSTRATSRRPVIGRCVAMQPVSCAQPKRLRVEPSGCCLLLHHHRPSL